MAASVMTKNKTLDMVYIAMFTVLIAICSWISIPTTVPFTLQTFGVFVTVGVLGGKRGSLSVLIYLLLGAIGIPVFAGFTGGMGIVLGSTGGYIIGFLLSALLMWGMEKLLGKKTWVLALSMVLGLLVCYIFPSNCGVALPLSRPHCWRRESSILFRYISVSTMTTCLMRLASHKNEYYI